MRIKLLAILFIFGLSEQLIAGSSFKKLEKLYNSNQEKCLKKAKKQ